MLSNPANLQSVYVPVVRGVLNVCVGLVFTFLVQNVYLCYFTVYVAPTDRF